jgi:serine/threonine protein kinase
MTSLPRFSLCVEPELCLWLALARPLPKEEKDICQARLFLPVTSLIIALDKSIVTLLLFLKAKGIEAMASRVGEQLGNYRLTRLLGQGGFAEVYLGEHLYLGTEAAIKMLHTRLEQDDADAFREEARTVARLKHPHIVRVLDFGIDNSTPFLVIDYAPNGSLRARHAKGAQLSLPTVLSHVKQLADALQYAHEQKLIHRDIKPENILLDERGDLVLTDFGIATMAQSSRSQNTQDVVGTVAYMAPEQVQGKPRPASDQYSLGIVVYEWLTGTRPFVGTFTEIATQHVLTPPPPLRTKRPDLPTAVDLVVMTALNKDPHRRFGSVKAFAVAFEQACQSGSAPMFSTDQKSPLASPPPIVAPGLSAPPASQVYETSSITPPPRAAGPLVTPPIKRQSPPPLLSSYQTSNSYQTSKPIQMKASQSNRNWPYVLLVVLLLVAAAIAVPLIISSQHGGKFQQTITTGPDITSIAVGTGVDTTTNGGVTGQSDTFHVGNVVYVVSDYSTDIDQTAITDTLTGGQATMGQGTLVNGAYSYYDWATVTQAGIYTWTIQYDGQDGASITFQVV